MTWVMTSEGKVRVGKILCMVRNYRAHAEEFSQEAPTEPTYFLKPATSIIHDGETVLFPEGVLDLQAEVELAVVMGSPAKGVTRESAFESVLGYAVFLDITARSLQREAVREGLPWTLAKGMDTFGPISTVRRREDVGDPHRLELQLTVNGATKQKASTRDMVHKIPDIIASMSSYVTLMRGDVLATGTPSGVPRIVPGDALVAAIENVGRLKVDVEARAPA